MKKVFRLPDVRSLSQILPSGAEGGKEFSRIIDLLLFYSANREGNSVNIFSDKSGDFYGLDSVIDGSFHKQKNVGYQYKFFPSPLSAKHRNEILESVKKAESYQSKLKLKRWILVTPDDLIQSGTKTGGGDVEWFSALKEKLDLTFEIEHWGHRKIQALFLETPNLCLYYYPELIPDGAAIIKTHKETRARYDINLSEAHNRIEFVGMSVYKAEATHGVAIDEIYIPVSVVKNTNNKSISGKLPRINPLTLLKPGARNVILGDPGSGKSTLLKFLSIAGASERLRNRYSVEKDERIAIHVTLRKYSDSLKQNKNISLIKYISESAQADLSLPSASTEFFEFYLESGRAKILFDGMDELPDASFKQLVRDRINTFLNCYPLATAIVTSRIVGYTPALGFNTEKFSHYSLAPLQLSEIECFVRDWYRVRIENPTSREANICDLIRILQDPEQTAILTLAENPLLLTIVTLVHRIDAVLPDERVVLYQKCTETLLNTWYTWKYKGIEDALKRGRVERTNRRRIETLARHMHLNAGQKTRKSRAVLPEDEVIKILASDILKHESISQIEDANVLANEFLDFIRQKAGLLIEVGDKQYSFIHLTFQEYLTATSLMSELELGGVREIWQIISKQLHDPRWHEVIRLLVAALKSDESQKYIVEKMLNPVAKKPDPNTALLLGGLLLDAVRSAEENKNDIFLLLFSFASRIDQSQNARFSELLTILWLKHPEAWEQTFKNYWKSHEKSRASLLLLIISFGLMPNKIDELTFPHEMKLLPGQIENFALLLGDDQWTTPLPEVTIKQLDEYETILKMWAKRSPSLNLIACVGQGLYRNLDLTEQLKRSFFIQLSVFLRVDGPFNDFYRNYTLMTLQNADKGDLSNAQSICLKNYWMMRNPNAARPSFPNSIFRLKKNKDYENLILFINRECEFLKSPETHSHKKKGLSADVKNIDSPRAHPMINELNFQSILQKLSNTNEEGVDITKSDLESLSDLAVFDFYISQLVKIFELTPSQGWVKSLRKKLLPNLFKSVPQLNQNSLDLLIRDLDSGNSDESVHWKLATFYLYDIWIMKFGGYKDAMSSPMRELFKRASNINFAPLNLARNLRAISLGEIDANALVAGAKGSTGTLLSILPASTKID